MFVELWEGLCWSTPQRRGQTRTVDPLPVRAPGDAAPCVYFDTAFAPCGELYLQVLARSLAA
jgi:hypothetical protein